MSNDTPFRKRIAAVSSDNQSVIVVALDFSSAGRADLKERAIKTIDAVHQHICAIKLNFHLILPLSASEISEINQAAHSYGLQSIADIKLNDIEHTNEVALENLVGRMGFDAVIVNPFIGSGALKSLGEKARGLSAGVIALVYMSHPGANEGYGLATAGDNGESMYKIFLARAHQADVDGIVVGATKIDILREVSQRGIPIYSPGIGSQGGDIEQAIRSGARYLIVGRSIVDSADPAKAAREIQARARSAR